MSDVTRYSMTEIFDNFEPLYDSYFRERGVKYIKQYELGSGKMRYPSPGQIRALTIVKRTWSYGDSYRKYAVEFYDDPELWWVIAWFNKKPAEFMLKTGQAVFIPTPLEYVLGYYGV